LRWFAENSFIPPDAVDACRKYKAEGFATLPKIMAVDAARRSYGRTLHEAVRREGCSQAASEVWTRT
jgi:hypothetical protein